MLSPRCICVARLIDRPSAPAVLEVALRRQLFESPEQRPLKSLGHARGRREPEPLLRRRAGVKSPCPDAGPEQLMPRRRNTSTAASAVAATEAGRENTRTVAVQTAQVLPCPPEYRPLAPIPAGPLGETPLEGYEQSALSLQWQARCLNTIVWPGGTDRATRQAVVRALAAQVQPALLDYAQFRELTTGWLLEFQHWLHAGLLQQVEETALVARELLQQDAARSSMRAADIDSLRARVAAADLRIAELQAWRAQVVQAGPPLAALAATQGPTVSIHEAVREAQLAARRSRPSSQGPVTFSHPPSGLSTPGSVAGPARPFFGPPPPPPAHWRQEDAYQDPHYGNG